MEFRQLRYFVAAAEEGNVGAAARRLHISQPPVTRQIQALEQHLGVLLFERGARGVRLTPAGAAFLEDARRMLELGRTSVDRSRAASRGEIGQPDVGYLGTAIYQTVPACSRVHTDGSRSDSVAGPNVQGAVDGSLACRNNSCRHRSLLPSGNWNYDRTLAL
uniref:LysR family transcriptional regulator n=1 Tax=Burkholderia sp. M701 TaxID=326454 RepID=UPI001E6567D9|nr:LysR family transcriptional regulator [Burkholderia sp. M701]